MERILFHFSMCGYTLPIYAIPYFLTPRRDNSPCASRSSAEIKTLTHTHTPSKETFSWFFCQFSGFLFAHTFFTSAHIFNIANWNVLTERLQYSNGGVYWFLIFFLPFSLFVLITVFTRFRIFHTPHAHFMILAKRKNTSEKQKREVERTHRN